MVQTQAGQKADILVFGPKKPLIERGLSGFNLHVFHERAEVDKLSPEIAQKIRGVAVTHLVQTPRDILSRFPKLEIISSFGVGYDHVDFRYARDNKIIVTNTPDVLTEEVADTALGLLIATLREFIPADRYVREGKWPEKSYRLSPGSLQDRTVGMVGMGRIGQAIARRVEACGVPVVYHSRSPAAGVSNKHHANLIEMAKAVDTLIVITPGGASTNNLINADVLEALGPRGVLINVARGSVVDEEALIAALKNGTILAAGLDVFANEPHVPDALRTMDNVVLLPHVASASVTTRDAMDQLIVDNLSNWFAGKPPLTPVAETPYEKPL
jgi:lactate dehydrogenase-like 2-hydroxyacid dehydrogenase